MADEGPPRGGPEGQSNPGVGVAMLVDVMVDADRIKREAWLSLREELLDVMARYWEMACEDYEKGIEDFWDCWDYEPHRGGMWGSSVTMDIIGTGADVEEVMQALIEFLEEADEKREVECGNNRAFWDGVYWAVSTALHELVDRLWTKYCFL